MDPRILLVTPDDVFSSFASEFFEHTRLGCRRIRATELIDGLGEADVVVIASPVSLHGDSVGKLTAWVEAGGILMAMGGPGMLAAAAGAADGGRVVEGWVRIDAPRTWTSFFDVDLHAFGGCSLLRTDDVSILGTWRDGSAAVTERELGAGRIIVIGADVWQSVGRILQGWRVTGPGHPAPDGSAPVGADGVLRCDDGLALSFSEDRAMPDGSPVEDTHPQVFPPNGLVPLFHRPHADLWRELVLHLLADAVSARDLPLAWLHYWPAGVEAVAHVSHDADQNQDEHARLALDAFARADVHVTWCHCWPGGYSAEVVEAIGEAGHEQALHYNALDVMDGMPWGEAGFKEQKRWAERLTGVPMISNKNHYTRWEGWTEFFEWCERAGITTDETRGASKAGSVGFPYGTSHVWFPVGPDGRRYDVVEVPLHTQDVGWQSDEAVIPVIADQALAHHGVAHFLFHGANMYRTTRVSDAVVQLGDELRARQMPAWTAAELGSFERLRRGVHVSVIPEGDGYAITVAADAALVGAGIDVQLPGSRHWQVAESSAPTTLSDVKRHGRDVLEITVDLIDPVTTLRLAPQTANASGGSDSDSSPHRNPTSIRSTS